MPSQLDKGNKRFRMDALKQGATFDRYAKDYKLHTALNNLLGTPDFGIEEACVLSMANVEEGTREGKPLHYLPLYMAFCIAEQTNGQLGPTLMPPPTF